MSGGNGGRAMDTPSTVLKGITCHLNRIVIIELLITITKKQYILSSITSWGKPPDLPSHPLPPS